MWVAYQYVEHEPSVEWDKVYFNYEDIPLWAERRHCPYSPTSHRDHEKLWVIYRVHPHDYDMMVWGLTETIEEAAYRCDLLNEAYGNYETLWQTELLSIN